MKTATIPPLRVTPELRRDAESVLREGETLSSFVEQALSEQIERRRLQREFIDRGLDAGARAKAEGRYASKNEFMDSLRSILDKARQ